MTIYIMIIYIESENMLTSHIPQCQSVGPQDFGLGYVVETFYDQPSAEVFLLAGVFFWGAK